MRYLVTLLIWWGALIILALGLYFVAGVPDDSLQVKTPTEPVLIQDSCQRTPPLLICVR